MPGATPPLMAELSHSDDACLSVSHHWWLSISDDRSGDAVAPAGGWGEGGIRAVTGSWADSLPWTQGGGGGSGDEGNGRVSAVEGAVRLGRRVGTTTGRRLPAVLAAAEAAGGTPPRAAGRDDTQADNRRVVGPGPLISLERGLHSRGVV